MGNQLGIAPSQIYPVEHYLMGLFESDLQYESSLGSTRFFKVARAKSDEGLVVVKVFVKHDPSLPLESHAEKLEQIKKNLANAVNCLPFQRVLLTDKAGFIMREYVKHSLYDRVSTRPFLSVTEKKWITFQVLCALHQCHKQKICHGDIKLENILITSWNWILLSDFASFKPTFLPEDNPADYTYFFDTSRRRTCYIAPERFIASINTEQAQKELSPLMSDGPYYAGTLTPEMDIFSAGCALLELWSEGTAPFEFSQLLSYRSGEEELVNKHLNGIENSRLRALLSSMLSRNPSDRKSAELYLDQERGKLFPDYFYSFLQMYMQIFSSTPIMPPDDKILRLHSDIKQIIEYLTVKPKPGEEIKDEDDGLILITTAVTANIRGLNFCSSKLNCLEILKEIAEHTTSAIILDRILPSILHLTKDASARVRFSAIDTVTECLDLVKSPPRSDINVFPEYIFPIIQHMVNDNSVGVRIALARNIANLADASLRFLDQTRHICPSEFPPSRYERELITLHDIVQHITTCLLTDSQAIVKQTLIEYGIAKICLFLGKNKAFDIILSHMSTFLNDKEDNDLRGSFFDCIVGVAAFVGWTCSDILIPLLQQGLTDPEEFVITKAIRATTSLVELGLIEKLKLIRFIKECSCFLMHPNLWIRHEIAGLISTAAKNISALDVQSKLMPVINCCFKSPLILVEQPEILMDYIHPAIPRSLYDSVIKFPEIEEFFSILETRELIRNNVQDGKSPQYPEMGIVYNNFFRRLLSEGLTDQTEGQLLIMKNMFIKINESKLGTKTVKDGKIVLDRNSSIVHCEPLCDKISKSNQSGKKYRKPETDSMNTEWQHMFGVNENSSTASNESPGSAGGVLTNTPQTLQIHIQPTPMSSLAEYSMPERTFLQERVSECSTELNNLKTKLRNDYTVLAANRDYDFYEYHSPIPANWRLKGSLIAHLHEHKAAVTKMCPLKPFGSYFASVSVDGTVKLWDCNTLDGGHSINRSRQSYLASTPLYSVASCDAGQSLAVAGKDGSLMLLRIDPNSHKMALQQARHLDMDAKYDQVNMARNDGPVVDMQSLDQSAQNVIIYATLYGGIIGWDIRMQNYAWRLQSDLKNGVITTMCVDPTSSWLAIGTSGGRHTCWDLRFTLPIAEIKHPHEARIRKIACHPTERSSLISASQGNNEVCIYNIETSHRQAAFWASNVPPLSTTSTNNHSVTALLPGISDQTDFILTAGSDQRIRYWDFKDNTQCRLVVPAPKDHLNTWNTTYDCRLIDGTRVTHELKVDEVKNPNSLGAGSRGNNTLDDGSRSGPDQPTASHLDGITDLVLCKTIKQTFLVSSSRDGVIKLWK